MKRREEKRESEIEGRKASASGGKLASGKGALSGEDHQACIHMSSIEYTRGSGTAALAIEYKI